MLVELSVKIVEGIESAFGKVANSKLGSFGKILKDVIQTIMEYMKTKLTYLQDIQVELKELKEDYNEKRI